MNASKGDGMAFSCRKGLLRLSSGATKKEISTGSDMGQIEPTEKVHLDPKLLDGLRHAGHQHYVRLAIFVILYFASAAAALLMVRKFGGNHWVYVANIPFYLLAAASLHGISLFTHEGVHGTLSARPWWNGALSIACA